MNLWTSSVILFFASSVFSQDLSCGEYCHANAQDPPNLALCLQQIFGDRPPKKDGIPILTMPNAEDGINYDRARHSWRGDNYPAAVVFARNTLDVEQALKCAVDNGYRVSVRAHGHSLQGLSTVSGYVIIDVHLTCNPDEFILDRSAQGEHIIPGSKYIATMKVQAGCTNAAIFHALYTKFDVHEKALAITGNLASVGVSGCTMGGCSGDITPYAGYGVDVLVAVDMILYNGTSVTATESNEYSDLLWATQGGGGGKGVVTAYTYRVIESPSPEGKISKLGITYDFDEEQEKSFATNLQDFLYNTDPAESSKYGGSGCCNSPWCPGHCRLEMTYLGGWKEGLEGLRKANLYDPNTVGGPNSTVVEQYEIKCLAADCSSQYDLPASGVGITQFNSWAETWTFGYCPNLGQPNIHATTGYVCADLGVSEDNCEDVAEIVPGRTPIRALRCPYTDPVAMKELVDVILMKAADPEAFMNNHGISQEYVDNMKVIGLTVPPELLRLYTQNGGLLIPKLEIDTLHKLVKLGFNLDHFQHGAPMMVDPAATALPWRNAAILSSAFGKEFTPSADAINEAVGIISEDNPSKVQGYYSYLGPIGTQNWKSLYFGDNYARLSQIKAKYDPYGIFSKPLTVELPEEEAASICCKSMASCPDKEVTSGCVCKFDPYCCSAMWDQQCVDEAKKACDLHC